MHFITVPTGNLAEHFYAVRNTVVNFYIYQDDETAVAFDAGMNKRAALNGMRKIGIDPTAIKHLFLTHSDYDHTGGIEAFPNAAIYLPADEVQMLNHTTPRGAGRYNKDLPRPYMTLCDEDTVNAGGLSVRAIATPGHTPGSMSYLLNETILVAGDTMALACGKARRFIIGMDKDQQEESLAKLAELEGISLLCTAHGGCTTDFQKAMEGWGGK